MLTLVRLLIVIVLVFALYWLVIRPWHARWGATDDEVNRSLPGDGIAPAPNAQVTRAITIEAPAVAIWPWLVQMGQEKAGLYSYEQLENLIGCDIHNSDHIVPAWQTIEIGDRVRMGPKGYPLFIVTEIVPDRALVMQAADPKTEAPATASWAFVLDEQPDGSTRLITRSRNQYEPTVPNFVLWRVVTEPLQFLMEQKMLRSIKTLVEQNGGQQPQAT
jgi:hypothetical protein